MGRRSTEETILQRALEVAGEDDVTAAAIHDLAERLRIDPRTVRRVLEVNGWVSVLRKPKAK